MQPTNQHKKQKSRCTFCGSPDYGKGCRFGPQGVHLHSDEPTKCSYCGSPDYGKGCRLNPTSNLHIRGAIYNNMYKESVQSFLDNSILLNELKKDYTEFACYALGIIDNKGNKLRTPITEQEELAYSSFTRTIIKLKKYLGSKTELLEATNLLEQKTTPVYENINQYETLLSYREKIDAIVNELYKTLDEAQKSGLSFEDVKKLVNA